MENIIAIISQKMKLIIGDMTPLSLQGIIRVRADDVRDIGLMEIDHSVFTTQHRQRMSVMQISFKLGIQGTQPLRENAKACGNC